MGEQLTLRLLTPEDMAAVQELWREAGLPFHPEGRDTLERLQTEAASGTSFFVGAFEGDRLIGSALGTDEGRKGWVNRLAVLPDERRRGVAASLVAFCEEEFLRRGKGLVCTLVEDWNEASLALFVREGYARRSDIFYFRKSFKGEEW